MGDSSSLVINQVIEAVGGCRIDEAVAYALARLGGGKLLAKEKEANR